MIRMGGWGWGLWMTQFDAEGKGASGAAVQNLNIMAGLDEVAGLRLQIDLVDRLFSCEFKLGAHGG